MASVDDITALAKRLEDPSSPYVLSEALEQASLRVPKTPLLAYSVVTLRGMAVVGVTERLHDFLVAVGKLRHIPVPPVDAVPRVNVTERDEVDLLPAATLARLRELTQIDQTLYDVARASQEANAFNSPERLGFWPARPPGPRHGQEYRQ